jgi:hypothetical protein
MKEAAMRPDLLPSRRAVLTGGVAALALSACGSESLPSILGGSGGTAAAPSGPPLATAEADAWIAAAGTTFMAGGHPMRLVGVERVGEAGGRPPELRQQGFIAAFDVLDGAPLAGDRTYTISHATIPTFAIHLSTSTSPTRMLASFN